MQGSPVRYPPIAELAEPMLRLAGIRINPKTNGLHNATYNTDLTLRKIPEGAEIKVVVPANSKLSMPRWSPDGSHFAFTNATSAGIELWIGDSATGRTHRLPTVRINEVMDGGGRGGGGGSVQWMPDGKSLLIQMVKPNRGAPPAEPTSPIGPNIQESLGNGKGVVTHEDMLQSQHDEDLFEFYATSQLAVVDSVSGAVSPIGKPGLLMSAHMSPDGNDYIVTSIHRPFSYSYQARQFPTEVEVWDRSGKALHKLASIPLGGGGRGAGGGGGGQGAGAAAADDNPADAAPQTGERTATGLPSEPAPLMWVEARGGNGGGGGGRGGRGGGGGGVDAANAGGTRSGWRWSRKCRGDPTVHSKVMALKAPYAGSAQVIFEADRRLNGIQFTENLHTAIIDGGGGGGRGGGGGGGGGGRGGGQAATTAYLIDFANPKDPPKPLWTRGGPDRYNQPGSPMEKKAKGVSPTATAP